MFWMVEVTFNKPYSIWSKGDGFCPLASARRAMIVTTMTMTTKKQLGGRAGG